MTGLEKTRELRNIGFLLNYSLFLSIKVRQSFCNNWLHLASVLDAGGDLQLFPAWITYRSHFSRKILPETNAAPNIPPNTAHQGKLTNWPGGIDGPLKQKSANIIIKESKSENAAAANEEFRITAKLLLIAG